MRLLTHGADGKIGLTEDLRDHQVPPYAILSHTWGPSGEEVTYRDVIDNRYKHKTGYRKIEFCARQAQRDNLQYFWVDTCCIDKPNHTELHEAINSMFRWYKNAAKCYVYLSDLSDPVEAQGEGLQAAAWESKFRASVWFTRGWTLQELLAPRSVEFFSQDGIRLGDKVSLEKHIHQTTGIALDALRGSRTLAEVDVDERFKWAETRQTTREEDWAYSLLGIFGVFLPLLYGEGKVNAVRRLKREIADATDLSNLSKLSLANRGKMNSASSPGPVDDANQQPSITELRNELLQWLGNPRDSSGHIPSPFPGTFNWLLDSDVYQNWTLDKSRPVFWCHGPPGVGKSVISSMVLHHLTHSLEQDPSSCLLHYFCEFANRQLQKKDDVLMTLLRQAILQAPRTVLAALIRFRGRLGVARSASSKDLCDALETICAKQKVFIVLDGLDELEQVKDIKVILSPFIKTESKLFIASRDLPEIHFALKSAFKLRFQPRNSDLAAYIKGQFRENDLEEILQSHPNLGDDILDKSNGVFLLTKILIHHLLSLATVKEMRQALRAHPTHLDEAYESSIRRIDDQSASHRKLAHRVMGWLVSAQRKLLVSELLHGLATEDDSDVIDKESLPALKTILKVCGGLVISNTQEGTITMVHATVYAWLRNRDTQTFHEDMAKSCLRYLTLRPLASGAAKDAVEMDQRLRSLPFLSYASVYWPKHITDRTVEIPFSSAVNSLIDNDSFRSAAFQASNYKGHISDIAMKTAMINSMSTGLSSLHASAYWNLDYKIETLLSDGHDINARDSQRWTPLHWACFNQSLSAIRVLVSEGAALEAKDSIGWTPIFWLALNGEIEAMTLLLENSANYLVRDVHGWTALRWAAAKQQSEVVTLLLRHHSDNHLSPQKAASLKSLTVQAALEDEDYSGDLIDECQQLSQYDEEFIDLYSLLEDPSFDITTLWRSGHFDAPAGNMWRTMTKANSSDDVEASREDSSSADWKAGLLRRAIHDGKLSAVKLLLQLGANVTPKKPRIKSALHLAAFLKDPRFAEYLIDCGADLEAVDNSGLTPLQQAVLNGLVETATLLINKGANVNAIYPGHELQDQPQDWDAFYTGDTGPPATKTPLMLACVVPIEEKLAHEKESAVYYPRSHSRLLLIRTIISRGGDVNMIDAADTGLSVIHYAARSRNRKIIEWVINAGADVQVLDNFGRTVFHHLVISGYSKKFHDGDTEACVDMLRRNCEAGFFNQSAEWYAPFRGNEDRWDLQENSFSPLAIALLRGEWAAFHALRLIGARFESSASLDAALKEPITAAQPEALELVLTHLQPEDGRPLIERYPDWKEWFDFSTDACKTAPDTVARMQAILTKLSTYGFDINATSREDEGQTLLHVAVTSNSSEEMIRALVELGANPCSANSIGFDPIFISYVLQKYNIMQLLLEQVKKIPKKQHWSEFLDNISVDDKSTMAFQVCEALAKAGLIQPGSSKIAQNEKLGTTPVDLNSDLNSFSSMLLTCAIEFGAQEFATALVKHGVQPNVTADDDMHPLRMAVEKGDAPLVKAFFESGAKIDVVDKNERTLLHLAAFHGHAEVTEVLVSTGLNLRSVDNEGWQPLHFAAIGGHAKTAEILLQHGALPQSRVSKYSSQCERLRPSGLSCGDRWTGTPLHLACMSGSSELVQLILSQGNIEVNLRTDSYLGPGESKFWLTQGGGPTPLHIALDTGDFYGRRGSILDQERMKIASLLIENGASVEGVADRIVRKDLVHFKEWPELWDKLRVGISS